MLTWTVLAMIALEKMILILLNSNLLAQRAGQKFCPALNE